MAEKCFEFLGCWSGSVFSFTEGKIYRAEGEDGSYLHIKNDKGIVCHMRKDAFKECEPQDNKPVTELKEEDEELTVEMNPDLAERLIQYALERGITPEEAIVEILKAELNREH